MSNCKSPLHEMVSTYDTDYWNDSCSIEELTYGIEHGAVGATTNPTIVMQVLQKEFHLWEDRIHEIIQQNPTWSEVEITWKLIEEMAVKGAELLYPVFERENGKKGRLSIQTNPANYRNAEAIWQQAVHFNTLAPNMQVKIPCTQAGIDAIEEATYHGVSINATVNFTVSQSLAVAEAIERGLDRREAAGEEISKMSPECTIMIGRVDDWIQVVANRDDIIAHPAAPHWAGVAVMKKTYAIYKEHGYRSRLLAAAYRHHLHWSELIGGNIIHTIPYGWARSYNASDVTVEDRMLTPVDDEFVAELYRKFPDFRQAYDEDGLTLDEFDTYGATVRTLRGFIKSYHDLQTLVREEFMLPNPDVK